MTPLLDRKIRKTKLITVNINNKKTSLELLNNRCLNKYTKNNVANAKKIEA